ncbi:hypothetical protein BJX61DRAFT_553082 [Aspergillus egyptiacus]|nr:hypothetical protein BJX61DRAFT_553082 [Aspergillus egyptiacus]
MSNKSSISAGPLVWLITGCTSGFGQLFVSAIRARGDRVIATARNIASLAQFADTEGVFLLQLDVTDSQDELNRKAVAAIQHFGQIDVLVNNAGYVLSGVWEEVSHDEAVEQFRTNFFGHINVTRAFLPHMRSRRSGTILFMSSIAGWMGVAAGGPYSASKFALEGAVESLHKEVQPLGIRVHLIVLGQFRTSILNADRRRIVRQRPAIRDYDAVVAGLTNRQAETNGKQPGDPSQAVERILDVVRGEGWTPDGQRISLRVVLGSDAAHIIRNQCLETLRQMDDLDGLTRSTDFPNAGEVKEYK